MEASLAGVLRANVAQMAASLVRISGVNVAQMGRFTFQNREPKETQ
jgi:hypothetical protein